MGLGLHCDIGSWVKSLEPLATKSTRSPPYVSFLSIHRQILPTSSFFRKANNSPPPPMPMPKNPQFSPSLTGLQIIYNKPQTIPPIINSPTLLSPTAPTTKPKPKMAAALRLFLLPLCLSLAMAAAATATLISETCKHTTVHYQLCVDSLSAEHPSQKADVLGLAGIAIRIAARNGTDTANFIAGLRENVGSGEPHFQQCLSDCSDAYVDAIEQLDDSTAALSSKGYNDTVEWVSAAMADVKVCQDGCHAVPAHKNVLTKRNGDFNRLCSIIISITNLLSASSH